MLIELGYAIVVVAEGLNDIVEVAISTYAHLYPNKMEAINTDLNRHGDVKNGKSASVVSGLAKAEKDHKK